MKIELMEYPFVLEIKNISGVAHNLRFNEIEDAGITVPYTAVSIANGETIKYAFLKNRVILLS